MSTAVPPQNEPPTNPTPAAPAPSSPPPAAPISAAPASEPWRAPDSAPAWARGKSAEEILAISQQMEQTLSRVVSGNQPAAPPAPAQPSQQQPPQFGDDDYVTGATFRQAAPQYVQQYVQPQFAQLQASVAQTALETVKSDPKYAPVFQKYGPEVYNKLASVDKTYWNVDNLRTIVNLVKADHVDELAREEAQRLAAVQMETFRSSGAGLPSVPPPNQSLTLQSDTLPPEYREKLAKVGINESTLDEFCRANDMTREQFFKQFGQTAIGDGRRG